ncbi:MAG: type II methionyl aminopeptidase [Thermoplasmatales archaeon B_DKE]|nr:MAG: type II methionyl aminopeptidase [Thermoplasmatales archaeon B_DKE]QRF75645.1 Methionine aminopeptidase [Thermoplasmatales archaeon]
MDQDAKKKYLEAGRLGKMALEYGSTLVAPGVKLFDVAEGIEKFISDNGGKASFPVNLSINNEAAHYSPFRGDQKKFSTGDVVKIDVGAQIDGYLSDNATTVEVGESGKYSDLIQCTREALNAAIKILRPMISARQIGSAIESVISSHGYKPVRNLGGHGIKRYDLHSEIFIPNYDDGNASPIRPDTVIAIEPFASTTIGMVHNGQGGNIYILSGTKVRKDEILYQNFNTIPFAERWVADLMPDYSEYLRKMVAAKEISQFPVLKEHSTSRISQAEHTIMILSDEIIVTTK